MHQCSGNTCNAINNFTICHRHHLGTNIRKNQNQNRNNPNRSPAPRPTQHRTKCLTWVFSSSLMLSFLPYSIFSPKVDIIICSAVQLWSFSNFPTHYINIVHPKKRRGKKPYHGRLKSGWFVKEFNIDIVIFFVLHIWNLWKIWSGFWGKYSG